MNSKISVIVPIYKVEKYLDRCIESIASQTYKNLEIILVDDGSPDNCPQICDKWAGKDSRIKVIHKQNGGVSSARNAGLDVATGDFVAFVDSDDYVEKGYIQTMYSKQKAYKVDFVCCSVNDVYEDTGKIEQNVPVSEDVVISDAHIFDSYYANYSKILIVPWNKLYKKEIFKNIRFRENMVYEDTEIILRILHSVSSIAIIPNILYNYLKTSTSCIGGGINRLKIDSTIKLFETRVEFIQHNNLNNYLSQELIFQFNNYGWIYRQTDDKGLRKILKEDFLKKYKKYHKQIKKQVSKNFVKMLLNCLYIRSF
jgi:glycosyltransferase involved in cell wall biosynthesis